MNDNNTDNSASCPPADEPGGSRSLRPAAEKIRFGNLEVDRPNVQALLAVGLFLITACIIALHGQNKSPSGPGSQIEKKQTFFFTVADSEDMIELLRENDLWTLDEKGAVPPLLLTSYPGNLDEFSTGIKKKLFFHGLLPVALTALAEVRAEKERLAAVLAKFPDGYRNLVFSDDYAAWGRLLSLEEIDFILALTRKYRSRRAVELVRRVDLLPLSMILAQAAIESSWATSRFAREGNNLFGVWTWGENGIVPESREEGKQHKVAAYDSILESVRAYMLIINRVPAYSELRRIRRYTMNPMKLADGLIYYSERRDSYVLEVKNFIEYNDLRKYEKCFLVDRPIEYDPNGILKVGLQQQGKLKQG